MRSLFELFTGNVLFTVFSLRLVTALSVSGKVGGRVLMWSVKVRCS